MTAVYGYVISVLGISIDPSRVHPPTRDVRIMRVATMRQLHMQTSKGDSCHDTGCHGQKTTIATIPLTNKIS